MKKYMRSSMLLAGIGMLASAAAAGAQIPVTKDARAGTVQNTQATTQWGPDSGRVMAMSSGDLELYRNMTDANIVAHILTGDSLEIEMSRLALSRASSQAVRDYAQTLLDAHTKNHADFTAMQKDEDIGIQPMANDPLAHHGQMALTQLRTLSGAEFDKAYIKHQVMHHDADAVALQQMADAARDDDLEQDIEEQLLPAVKQHLARARDLATQLGVDTSMHSMHRMP